MLPQTVIPGWLPVPPSLFARTSFLGGLLLLLRRLRLGGRSLGLGLLLRLVRLLRLCLRRLGGNRIGWQQHPGLGPQLGSIQGEALSSSGRDPGSAADEPTLALSASVLGDALSTGLADDFRGQIHGSILALIAIMNKASEGMLALTIRVHNVGWGRMTLCVIGDTYRDSRNPRNLQELGVEVSNLARHLVAYDD